MKALAGLSSVREDYEKRISSGLSDLGSPTFEKIVQALEKTQERINKEVHQVSRCSSDYYGPSYSLSKVRIAPSLKISSAFSEGYL